MRVARTCSYPILSLTNSDQSVVFQSLVSCWTCSCLYWVWPGGFWRGPCPTYSRWAWYSWQPANNWFGPGQWTGWCLVQLHILQMWKTWITSSLSITHTEASSVEQAQASALLSNISFGIIFYCTAGKHLQVLIMVECHTKFLYYRLLVFIIWIFLLFFQRKKKTVFLSN